MGCLITVSGTVGGIGASTFAYALALSAPSPAVLIDGHSQGAPLDVLVGAERQPGVRWSQVRVRSDAIDPVGALAALPQQHGVALLSSDARAVMDPVAAGLLAGLWRQQAVVVLDLPPRHDLRASLRPDLDLLLLPATLPGIAALAPGRTAGTRLVVIDTGCADLAPAQLRTVLDADPPTVRWQRGVRLACTAGLPLPTSSDAMQVARSLLEQVAHGA